MANKVVDRGVASDVGLVVEEFETGKPGREFQDVQASNMPELPLGLPIALRGVAGLDTATGTFVARFTPFSLSGVSDRNLCAQSKERRAFRSGHHSPNPAPLPFLPSNPHMLTTVGKEHCLMLLQGWLNRYLSS